MAGTLERLPWIREIEGDLEAKRREEAEVGERVRAYIFVVEGEKAGEERRAEMTEPPCFPVAPVIKREVDMLTKSEVVRLKTKNELELGCQGSRDNCLRRRVNYYRRDALDHGDLG